MKEQIRYLYNYNAWANNRVFDACAELTQEQFLAGSGSSTADASIRDTLVHVVGAQEIWLARSNGVSPTTFLKPDDFGTLALIRQYWDQVEAHTQGYLARVEEDVLEEVMEYTTTRGEPYAQPRWQTLMHLLNHSTQHRSEVATLLTRMGHSPGELDLLVYIRKQH